MRFSARHGALRLVYIPREYEIIHGHRKLIRGMDAQFSDHMFDSVQAQKANRWSDDERRELEVYIMEHPDFGRGIYPVEGYGYTTGEAEGEVSIEPISEEHIQEGLCVVTFATPYGSQPCANRSRAGSEFCAVHAKYGEAAKAAQEVTVG